MLLTLGFCLLSDRSSSRINLISHSRYISREFVQLWCNKLRNLPFVFICYLRGNQREEFMPRLDRNWGGGIQNHSRVLDGWMSLKAMI